MKPTTLSALVLTLLMLLLVLLAAFFFAYQGHKALREDLAAAEEDYTILNTDHARLRLDHLALQDASTKTHDARVTAESESARLDSQLVEADQNAATLEAQMQSIVQTRDVIEETRASYEATGPIVTFIEPQPSSTAIIGDEQNMIIVISDAVGVSEVSISINEQLLEDVDITPGTSVIVTRSWTPSDDRQIFVSVSGTNSNNITGDSKTMPIMVISPTPSRTPTPTARPNIEVTSIATARP